MTTLEQLLPQLTLDEKVALLAGRDLWHSIPVPRLGIPVLKVSDGPNGVRGAYRDNRPPSICLPVGIALGATWNTALVEDAGRLLAGEAKRKNAHILLSPTVNIHRTPIAGRNFECFAEDPYLSGTIAAAYINGLQRSGVGACIKHFVCNDQEHERMSISAEVTERPLHEIYLEPFRLAMRLANPWSLMSGYNRDVQLTKGPLFHGVAVTLDPGEDLDVVQGALAQGLPHLDGWGTLQTSGAAHPVYPGLPARGHRAVARWWVRGEGRLVVRYTAGRGGMGELEAEI